MYVALEEELFNITQGQKSGGTEAAMTCLLYKVTNLCLTYSWHFHPTSVQRNLTNYD